MKRSSTKLIFLAALTLLATAACATKQVEKTVDFQMRWVRAANEKQNWTFHRSEQGTPFIDNVSIISGNGVDGVGLWTRDSAIRQWFLPVSEGVYSGIVAVKNRVYFGGSDGQFYCLDRSTGKVLWTFPTRSENLAAPLVEEGVVYFLAGNNVLYAIDALSGKLLWNYRREEVNNLSVRGGAKPTKLGDHLFAGFSDGYLVSLNAADGALQWERKLSTNLKFVDIDGTPVVDGNTVFAASYDGSLYALSTNDGQIQWRLEEGGATAVTVDKDRLYFGSTNQVVFCLKKDTGEVIWKFSMEEGGVPTQPVVHNGVVFVGSSESDLVAIDASTGKKAGAFRPGFGVFSTPFVDPSKKEVIFLSNGSNIYSLDYTIGTNIGKAVRF